MKSLFGNLKRFVRLWPESWAIPLGLFGLYWSYYLLWLLFPFAAAYPPEGLQRFVYAGFVLMLFNGLSWLGIKLNLFGLYHFYKHNLNSSFTRLKAWQKISFLFSAYFGFLFLLVEISKLI
jgi:hypothetical protein